MPIFSHTLTILAVLVLFVGIQQIYIAIRKHGSPLYLTFGLASFAVFGTIIGNIFLVNSHSAAELILAEGIRVVFVALSMAILPWFASYYTGYRPRAFLMAYSSVSILFMLVRMTQPFFLTYDAILTPGMLHLPWGETISVFNANPNWLQPLYYVIGCTSLAFAYVAAFHQFRKGERVRASALAVSVTLLVLFVANDLVLVLHNIRWITLGDFGWLAMILLLGFIMTEDVVRSGEIQQSLVESESTLRVSEEKYRLVAENVSDVIWTMDLDMKGIFLSPSIEKLLGWTSEEGVDLRLEQLLPPESFRIVKKQLMDELDNDSLPGIDPNRYVTFEVNQLRRDGTLVWTEVTARFMRDEGGKPAGVIGVTRDISKRKAAEEALIEHNRVLTEINRLSIGLASLPSGENIHPYCTKELRNITGAAIVAMTEYDPKTKQLFLKNVATEESITISPEIAGIIAANLNAMTLDDDSYAMIMTETVGSRKTLQQIVFGKIPEEVTARIDRELGVDRYIPLAYIFEGTLYGTSVLAMRKDLPDPPEDLLRSFASLAAVSLRRNRAEEELRKSLEEKDVLIREVHHRVKNNLQIIISLLYLQAEQITDEGALSLQYESIARLHSMALIHERIYRSENFVNIDMEPYLKELTRLLLTTFSVDEDTICVTVTVNDVSLDVNRAIPCALLVNEMITNVLKHGIKKDAGPGRMDISFTREGAAYRLVVTDRGPSMDAAIFYSEDQKTLGLQLIKALVRQLGGTVELTVQDGCRFTIEFPAGV